MKSKQELKFNEIVDVLTKEFTGFILYVKDKKGKHIIIKNLDPYEILGFVEIQKQNVLNFCKEREKNEK